VNELSDQQLLSEYAECRRETAFAELVRRHLDLVYSAAWRMVRDAALAQDVTQGVFIALAGNAGRLAAHPVLSGWLHCTARNLAAKAVRSESRRRAREQEAAAMHELLSAQDEPAWEAIAPHLDAALGDLSDADREALLFRYFEKKSAPEMAGLLDISEAAAQKRVARALERLREQFTQRRVGIGAAGLVALLSANAVQSAPTGLAATISATVLADATLASSAFLTATQTTLMTTLQKTLVTVTIGLLAGAGIYEAHHAAQLHHQVQSLEGELAPLRTQVGQLKQERDAAVHQLAAASTPAAAQSNPVEILKLRGEVGALRAEKKQAGEKSALSKVTADPATKAMLRSQQKLGMSALYKDLAQRLGLNADATDKLNESLADGVMEGLDLVTQALHDGRTQAEINQIFAGADQRMQARIRTLLGDDGLAKYNDYSQNLASTLTAQQFAPQLTGDSEAKQSKQNQLQQAMQEATAAALQSAGLPPNSQVIPILNFANIASVDQGNQSLDLLDGIYADVAARSAAFLTPGETANFQNYRTNAIVASRAALTMNRTLMAPLAQ
jgi:RNA polymerase sigma factor (sigma-70 family)